jgi:hypothetical protein
MRSVKRIERDEMAKTKKQSEFQKETRKILEQTKKNLLKFSQDTLKLAKKAEKEVGRVSKIGRLHLDILGMRKKRENLCQEIGEKIIGLDSSGKIDLVDVKPLCVKVRGLDNRIKKKKAEVERVKRKDRKGV